MVGGNGLVSSRTKSSSRRKSVTVGDDPAELARSLRLKILESGLPFDSGAEDEARQTQTKYRILNTSIELFAERGFEGCGMRDIASAVGIKAPAIYNHYASKDEVLAAAMEHILGRFFHYLLHPLEELETEHWLAVIVHEHVRFQLNHRNLSGANDALLNSPGKESALPPDVYRRITGVERDYIELIRALVRLATPETDPDEALMTAFAIAAMGDRVVAWHRPSGPLTVDEVADFSWQLAERMVNGSA